MQTKREPVKAFRGINNVADPLALDWSWLAEAADCIIDGNGKLRRAPGFVSRLPLTAGSGGYATEDQRRLYLVDDGDLLLVNEDLSTRTLASGLTQDTPTRFAEVNGIVFYSNGTDRGVIYPDARVGPWGIEPPRAPGNLLRGSGALGAGLYQVCCTLTDSRGQESGSGNIAAISVPADSSIAIIDVPQLDGYRTNVYVSAQNDGVFRLLAADAGPTAGYNVAPDALGRELPFLFANAPHGILPAYFGGRMYLADPHPELDLSAIWRSFPLHYHLFDDGSEGVSVPGAVRMLVACDTALIVGTDRGIYSLDEAGALELLAPYGVPEGEHAFGFRGAAYFWTERGLCSALPFVNLTESTISVDPGISACAALIEQDGFRRVFVALEAGGEAYNNPRSSP